MSATMLLSGGMTRQEPIWIISSDHTSVPWKERADCASDRTEVCGCPSTPGSAVTTASQEHGRADLEAAPATLYSEMMESCCWIPFAQSTPLMPRQNSFLHFLSAATMVTSRTQRQWC